MMGNSLWVIVMDDYSRKKWSFFVKQKSMVGEVMLSLTEQLSGLKMTTK
jgi:hypothetical protein